MFPLQKHTVCQRNGILIYKNTCDRPFEQSYIFRCTVNLKHLSGGCFQSYSPFEVQLKFGDEYITHQTSEFYAYMGKVISFFYYFAHKC